MDFSYGQMMELCANEAEEMTHFRGMNILRISDGSVSRTARQNHRLLMHASLSRPFSKVDFSIDFSAVWFVTNLRHIFMIQETSFFHTKILLLCRL